jgi:hypothetical protein
MAEKEIELLKEQINRLNDKKFDLQAWKNHTLIFLERIFGKENSKIKMIQSLTYDYSSWSLRDTAAGGSDKEKDPVRIQAKEILEAAIAELESLGLPQEKQEKLIIKELLEDELTGKQVKKLEAILHSEEKDKEEKIIEILENLEKESLATTIAKLLTS